MFDTTLDFLSVFRKSRIASHTTIYENQRAVYVFRFIFIAKSLNEFS